MSLDYEECAGVTGLLQPYVDGELSEREQLQVAEHIERCGECRGVIQEQQRVRAALRGVELPRAPSALRANILAELDTISAGTPEVDPPEVSLEDASGGVVSLWGRFSALGRGGLLMVPAAAAAIGLFFMVRGGGPENLVPSTIEAAHVNDGAAHLPIPSKHDGVFPTQHWRAPDIELVSNAENADEATLEYRDLRQGHRVLDRQRHADSRPMSGRAVHHQGAMYYIDTDEQGRTQVEFQMGRVHHRLSMVGSQRPHQAEVAILLDVGRALRLSHSGH